MSAQPSLVLMADVGQRHKEVLTGLEVDLPAEEIKGHEERLLRDLPLLLVRACISLNAECGEEDEHDGRYCE